MLLFALTTSAVLACFEKMSPRSSPNGMNILTMIDESVLERIDLCSLTQGVCALFQRKWVNLAVTLACLELKIVKWEKLMKRNLVMQTVKSFIFEKQSVPSETRPNRTFYGDEWENEYCM